MADKTGDQLLADNAALTTKVTNLEATVGTLTSENTALKADKAKLTTDLATANSTVASATSERDSLKTEIASLKTERDSWKAKADPVQVQVAAQLAALGIVDGKKTESASGSKTGETKLTLTQKALKAKGLPLDTKIELGAPATMATEE